MAFVHVTPGDPIQAQNLDQVIDSLNGVVAKGQPIQLTQLTDAVNYALTVQNLEATNSRALNVLRSNGAPLITANASGVTLGSPLILPTGSITSAMIADGTIVSADLATGAVATTNLAANAATQSASPTIATSGPSTSSTTFVDVPDLVTVLTTAGGDLLVWTWLTLQNSTAGVVAFITLNLDTVDLGQFAATSMAAADTKTIFFAHRYAAPVAGAHAVKTRWQISAGSLTTPGFQRDLLVMELKR